MPNNDAVWDGCDAYGKGMDSSSNPYDKGNIGSMKPSREPLDCWNDMPEHGKSRQVVSGLKRQFRACC